MVVSGQYPMVIHDDAFDVLIRYSYMSFHTPLREHRASGLQNSAMAGLCSIHTEVVSHRDACKPSMTERVIGDLDAFRSPREMVSMSFSLRCVELFSPPFAVPLAAWGLWTASAAPLGLWQVSQGSLKNCGNKWRKSPEAAGEHVVGLQHHVNQPPASWQF